jgi:hypothetical protein
MFTNLIIFVQILLFELKTNNKDRLEGLVFLVVSVCKVEFKMRDKKRKRYLQ